MAWETSNRRDRLPKNWHKIRPRVIRRDGGVCQGVLEDSGQRCGQPGTDVDHIIPGDNHALDNLQLLCRQCHTRKTQRESAAAREAARIPTRLKGRPGTRSEGAPDVW
jgi:5-methylcytosine-specific restriction endonuclease McrA